MRLELPYPPGVNTLYGVRAVMVKGRPMAFPYKTHAHRNYTKAVRLAAGGWGEESPPMWSKPALISLKVKLFRPRRLGDIDGPLKTLLDVLQGIIFENDDQVSKLEVDRDDDKHRPRVELEACELEAPRDLGDLLNDYSPPAVRAETTAQKLRRLAKPNVVKGRPEDDDLF